MIPFPALLCAVAPESLGRLRPYPLTPALLAYQLGPGPRLLRASPPTPLGGGLLAVREGEEPVSGDFAFFCRQAVRECQARGARGVFVNWGQFQRGLWQLTHALGESLARVGLSLYVPERYAGAAPGAKVLLSSALSGGSLELRLREGLERYGPERTVLALERMAEDFDLPSPSGCGTPLSPEALDRLRRRTGASVFWSGELCARYFTYAEGQRVHFVLFDDGACLRQKLELAHRLGIRQAMCAWDEIAACAPAWFGQG